MKKKLLIVFVNIIFLIFLFLILDFYAFYSKAKTWFENSFENYVYTYYNVMDQLIPVINKKDINNIIFEKYHDGTNLERKYRPVENPDYKKRIVIFGCSFAYGDKLNDNETFSHNLAKLVKYSVINRAFSGRSVQHMLYQLESDDFYKIIPKPDYVIYLFIKEQIRRTYIPCYDYERSIYYKEDPKNKDKLKLEKVSSKYFGSYIAGALACKQQQKLGINYKKEEIDFYFKHVYQSLEAIRKHWGDDVKFIFLVYDDYSSQDFADNLDKLKDKGVIVIKIEDLDKNKTFLTEKYHISEKDCHPNAQLWKELTPIFVKYLNNLGELK